MNPQAGILQTILAPFINTATGDVSKAVGGAVANSPAVQSALGAAQSQVQKYLPLIYLGAGMYAANWLFYYLPRYRKLKIKL